MLSFLEYLGDRREGYKTVSAQAIKEAKIIKIPFEAFCDAFQKFPDNMARVVQVRCPSAGNE